MKSVNVCMLGFGNVNRALLGLLVEKRDWMRAKHGLEWQLTGVATRRMGFLADAGGLNPAAILAGALTQEGLPGAGAWSDVRAWLVEAQAGVLFEASSLDAATGQPAIDHLRAALEAGAHAITANKGPLVHAYAELRDLAAARGKSFLFEAAFMGGAPVFSLFRECLPLVEVRRFRAVVNATTTVVLREIEAGRSFEEAIGVAQSLGIAETDPSADIDGWDAAVKVTAFANVVMGVPLALRDVAREGIRGLDAATLRASRAAGKTWRLVARGERSHAHSHGRPHGHGRVIASVRPEEMAVTDPLAVDGSTLLLDVETDVHPGLTIAARNADARGTAYDMLADLVHAMRVGCVR